MGGRERGKKRGERGKKGGRGAQKLKSGCSETLCFSEWLNPLKNPVLSSHGGLGWKCCPSGEGSVIGARNNSEGSSNNGPHH